MKGDRLCVKLNGEEVITNAQLPGLPREGTIALQHHGGWNAETKGGPARRALCSSALSTSRS